MFLLAVFALLTHLICQIYRYVFPTPSIDPKGKYVLISGCDTGFGRALTIELDQQGFHVIAGVFDSNNEHALRQCLSSQATVVNLDITRQDHIDYIYEITRKKTKTLHALVNNAGISTSGFIDWMTMDSIRRIMEVNFFAHVTMTKTFLPLLIAKQDSRVINICSVAGFITAPMKGAYSASKYALESFSDCLRREMAPWALHVSIVEPGPMRTPIIQGHDRFMQGFWNRLSTDVQERWGEDFSRVQTKKLADNFLYRYAEDPTKVVQALQHAVNNSKPEIRYRPGWQSKFVYLPLSLAPAWLTDMFFIRAINSDIQPAGVQQQHGDE
jgi:NAD(P)-dependent dehydrogenase (short-subunit alcohol dehydrogenase family)